MPRQFIRHPTEIPIQICQQSLSQTKHSRKATTHNFSEGGLSCEAENALKPGDMVEIEILINKPPFKTTGQVVWCHESGHHYIIGIGFKDLETAYAVRMVEQVCHIEQYRKEILQNEGRFLSSEEAALEWISSNAEGFPPLGRN